MEHLLFWHWWVIGFALLGAEVLIPGTFCMWLGIAGLVTGVAAWVFPGLSWQAEVIVFSLLSVVSVALWFRYRPMSKPLADNGLNQRGHNFVGQVFTLVTPIVDGVGKARVADSEWRVNGPALPAGAKVRVVALDGNTLKVEAAT